MAGGFSNQALQRHLKSGALRRKTEIGGTSDPQEAAADQAASRIMAGGKAAPCACGGACSDCASKGSVLRRKSDRPSAAASVAGDVFGGRSGRPLDAATRAFFEPHYGDLSDVRIHDGRAMSEAAAALGARAFAAGPDIGFAEGEYAPQGYEGRRLLAHELAHVAQGDGVLRRQPLEEKDDEEEDTGGVAPPKQPSLLSLDSSNLCGPNGCFTDDDIAKAGVAPDPNEPVVEDDGSVSGGTLIGNVGPFAVVATKTNGKTGEKSADTPVNVPPNAMGPVIGSAGKSQPLSKYPTTNPPQATKGPTIVQGDSAADIATATSKMASATGHGQTTFGAGALDGVTEVTIIAHGSQVHARINSFAVSPKAVAKMMVKSGWKGGTVRLSVCKTGLCNGNSSTFAQELANELAALGTESAVIAPVGNANISGQASLPRVRPEPPTPGGPKQPLEKPGKGWEIFVPQERPEPPFWSAKSWGGAGMAAGMTALFMGLGYIHARGVQKRVERQRNESGYAPYGPTGHKLYDLGAWILDPTDQSGRSIGVSQRLDMAKWRQTMRDVANSRKPGEYYKCYWDVGDGFDSLGDPKIKRVHVTYRKGPNGYWYAISSSDTDEYPPDLNKIIDENVSDEEIRIHLELPPPGAEGGII